MNKRVMSVIAAAAMTVSMLAGCGSTTGSSSSSASEAAVSESAGAATEEVAASVSSGSSASSDQAKADHVADLIDAIYVQERTDDTDAQCEEAKKAWDALTDAQKALVQGEYADPDYFGRDTGDASADDPLNEDGIGEKLEAAKSQQDVYKALQTLPYFKLTIDEFRIGIEALRQQQAEIHQDEQE